MVIQPALASETVTLPVKDGIDLTLIKYNYFSLCRYTSESGLGKEGCFYEDLSHNKTNSELLNAITPVSWSLESEDEHFTLN